MTLRQVTKQSNLRLLKSLYSASTLPDTLAGTSLTASSSGRSPVTALQDRDDSRLRRLDFTASRLLSTTRHLSQDVVQPFRLAQTGEGIKECELVQWFIKEGDAIDEFERVCEVQSDKATIEITSPYAGIISKLHHAAGDVVPVGDVLADITMKKTAASNGVVDIIKQPAAVAPSSITPSSSVAEASPAVRHLARELHIDLNTVPGTGPQGRVTKADILQHVDQLNAVTSAGSTINGLSPSVTAVHRDAIPTAEEMAVEASVTSDNMVPPRATTLEDLVVPLRGYRRAMVRSMTLSSQIPHFHFCEEILMDPLADLRQHLKDSQMLNGTKLTYMPFIIKAAAIALQSFPTLNSSLAPDGMSLLQHGRINIGIAVATPHGLVVPNIKDVGSKNILTIASDLKALQTAAQANQLRAEDLVGGTFTISNIGTVGGTYATPLVNPPEVAIMALGKIRRVPMLQDDSDKVVPASIVSISMGADHRVVDGATLGHFTCAFKDMIENPGLMMLTLQ